MWGQHQKLWSQLLLESMSLFFAHNSITQISWGGGPSNTHYQYQMAGAQPVFWKHTPATNPRLRPILVIELTFEPLFSSESSSSLVMPSPEVSEDVSMLSIMANNWRKLVVKCQPLIDTNIICCCLWTTRVESDRTQTRHWFKPIIVTNYLLSSQSQVCPLYRWSLFSSKSFNSLTFGCQWKAFDSCILLLFAANENMSDIIRLLKRWHLICGEYWPSMRTTAQKWDKRRPLESKRIRK